MVCQKNTSHKLRDRLDIAVKNITGNNRHLQSARSERNREILSASAIVMVPKCMITVTSESASLSVVAPRRTGCGHVMYSGDTNPAKAWALLYAAWQQRSRQAAVTRWLISAEKNRSGLARI